MATPVNDTKLQDATRVYNTLCSMLNNIKWSYERDDEKLTVKTSAIGNDLKIPLHIYVSTERQVMYVKSPMPFSVSQDKRQLVGNAVHIANYSMLNGCFEYDISDGYVGFKIVVPFAQSIISEEVCHYMVMLTCSMVDKFNDKFLMLINGKMTLQEFKVFTAK